MCYQLYAILVLYNIDDFYSDTAFNKRWIKLGGTQLKASV